MEKKLNALPTFELKFKHEACSKCGVVGDPRYIVAGCHTKSEYMHIKPLSSWHPGSRKYKHTGTLIDFRFITGKKKHTGYKSCNHSGSASNAYHPGNKQKGFIARIGTYFFGSSSIWGKDVYYWYDCCNSKLNLSTFILLMYCCYLKSQNGPVMQVLDV